MHQRTGLLDMVPQHLPQGAVKNMGRSMVCGRRLSERFIDCQHYAVVFGQGSGNNLPLMNDQPGGILDGIFDGHFAAIGGQGTPIADLPAGFAVKRRPVSNDLDGTAGFGRLNLPAVRNEQQHPALFRKLAIPDKFRFDARADRFR